MLQTISAWASIVGLLITIINLALIADTKRRIDAAVETTRFDLSKDALISHCNDALTSLSALRHLTREGKWRDVADKCQDVRRAVLQAKAAATTLFLAEAEIARLTAVLTQLSTLEKQAERAQRDPARVSADVVLAALVKQNANVATVLAVAGATYRA